MVTPWPPGNRSGPEKSKQGSARKVSGLAPRESREFEVVIVGGGSAGLSVTIRRKQLAIGAGRELTVCFVEMVSEDGAQNQSSAVIDTVALSVLYPDWKERGAERE